ncbi:hypothetical protein AVEN_132007-1 [Araneus ventricosus]|uniref:Uncharacterized protein n=1 Tax=Araneus ventricosus TaxID=182803 RepID=A0A4Y2B5E8_ARAVE|nr:hypothetical protein AVEN_132007-1 [Araneus ventricosus]
MSGEDFTQLCCDPDSCSTVRVHGFSMRGPPLRTSVVVDSSFPLVTSRDVVVTSIGRGVNHVREICKKKSRVVPGDVLKARMLEICVALSIAEQGAFFNSWYFI